MKIRFMSLLLALCMALSLFPTMTMAANITLSAVPSKTNFVMNGKPVSITQAYDVSSTNYLQVRAIAALLNGTASQFNVSWDGQYAVIETGKPYSGTVTETELKDTTNVRLSGTKFKLDNTVVTFEAALLIDGDTNYLQLHEFAQKLSGTASQFNVYWDSAESQAVIQRLAYWGVVPTGKFDPNSTVTYGEMTNYLYKLMAYDDKYLTEGGRQDFTKADIAKFGIGGNTSANAKCTIEQAKILCDKAFLWWNEVAYKTEAKFEAARKALQDGNGRAGVKYVATGDLYTIKTCLGTKGQQPYLVINAEGKGELSSSKTQNYRITYKGMKLTEDGDPVTLCTIQTADGKYLATSGLPINGSRLITRTASYVWEIRVGPQLDYQQVNYMVSTDNQWQVLNASGWNTAEGTPIITWNWNQGQGGDNNNCGFIFEKVK